MTNRQAHEQAAGMNLAPEFFETNGIDPNARVVADFMDCNLQKRAFAIGDRLGKLPFDVGWKLLHEPQAELGGVSCKEAADQGRFGEIEVLLNACEASQQKKDRI